MHLSERIEQIIANKGVCFLHYEYAHEVYRVKYLDECYVLTRFVVVEGDSNSIKIRLDETLGVYESVHEMMEDWEEIALGYIMKEKITICN